MARNCIKCYDLYSKAMLLYITPWVWVWGVGDQARKKMFLRDCITCSDLHRKVMFAADHSVKLGEVFAGNYSDILICT